MPSQRRRPRRGGCGSGALRRSGAGGSRSKGMRSVLPAGGAWERGPRAPVLKASAGQGHDGPIAPHRALLLLKKPRKLVTEGNRTTKIVFKGGKSSTFP